MLKMSELARSTCKGKQTDLRLLDFFKTFDKVSRSKCIWKSVRFAQCSCPVVHAFLCNRSQSVVGGE